MLTTTAVTRLSLPPQLLRLVVSLKGRFAESPIRLGEHWVHLAAEGPLKVNLRAFADPHVLYPLLPEWQFELLADEEFHRLAALL